MEHSDQFIDELLQDPQIMPHRGFSKGAVILLVGFVLMVILIGIQLARQNMTQPTAGLAPDFSLTTFDGDIFNLADQRGKVVIINFWASWCIPCRDEAPILQSIWKRYRSRDVVVVGVAYLDMEQGSRDFISEFNITYPNGHDIHSRVSDAYHITGVPETFIVDQNGEIVFFIPAPVIEGQLDKVIEPLLSKSNGS